MLDALFKTFQWPGLHVTFCYEGQPVAVFNASKVNERWFALPHSDSFGFRVIEPFEEGRFDLARHLKIIRSLVQWEGLYEGAGTGIVAKSVELTDIKPGENISGTGIIKDLRLRSTFPLLQINDPVKVVSVIDLSQELDVVMQHFSSNVRRKIRKASANGIVVKDGLSELLDDFYEIYRKGIHRHGSFGLPKRFFSNLLNEDISLPGPKARIFIAYLHNIPVGSVLLLSQSGFSENNAFATLTRFNHLYTSYALHWAMIRYSVEAGITSYSLGRSTPGSGVDRFKQQFGGIEQPLYYSSGKEEKRNRIPFKLVSPVIKALPLKVVQCLDGFVAGKVY